MTEDRTLAMILLGFVATGAWTPLPYLKGLVSEHQRQAVGAAMAALVRQGLVWHSYEAVVLDGHPVLIARYSRPYEVGDPLIGRKVVREDAA